MTPSKVSDAGSVGSPSIGPRWLQVDGAADYMGGVSRKTVYAAVAAGMRVARLNDGEPRRDSKGRRSQGRMLFYTAWIDEFLQARSTRVPLGEREAAADKPLNPQREDDRPRLQIATPLQRPTESEDVRAPREHGVGGRR